MAGVAKKIDGPVEDEDGFAMVVKDTRNVKPTWSGAPAKSWKEPNAQARKVGGNRFAGATDDDEGWNMN